MSRIKVSDGDLVVVTVGGELNYEVLGAIARDLNSWFQMRGLHEVRLTVYHVRNSQGMEIKVFSVNDVFEDEVLNKS